MARSFLVPINLNGLELQGAVIGNLSTGSIDAITSGTGRIQYDSTLNVLKYRDNSGWQTISTGGGSFTLGSTSISLGSTTTTIAGLSSVTSTTFVGALTGNASTATTLATARAINGVNFDGSAAITVTAAAGTLSGTTLNSGVTASSLTSVGTLANLTVTNTITGSVSGNAGTATTLATARNINGVSFNGSANITVTATATNALTIGTGLSGTSYNGSSAVTIAATAGSTSAAGILQLSDAINSTSTSLAATANAAKTAYDRGSTGITNAATAQSTADAALPKAGGTMSGAIAMGGSKITGLGTPTADTDAATKAYVDSASLGIDWKASVHAATTANGTLATAYANGSVIDGVTLVTGDRILIKDQTTGTENGIYTVNASGAPTRATDADANAEVTANFAVFVEEGTANADSGWVLTTNAPITVGTTALVFTQFTGLGQVTAGDGLTKTGNTLNAVGTADRITANADSLDIASTYVGQTSITTLGTVGTGTWNATIITPAKGGTGVDNTGKTITLGGNLVTSGAFATTLTVTNTTNATLPAGTTTLLATDGSGASLTSLNASNLSSGTVPGDRGVSAGSTTASFVEYNGTTATAGQFDGGTVFPTGTTRLNYSGTFVAKQLVASTITSWAGSSGGSLALFTPDSATNPSEISITTGNSSRTGSSVAAGNIRLVGGNLTGANTIGSTAAGTFIIGGNATNGYGGGLTVLTGSGSAGQGTVSINASGGSLSAPSAGGVSILATTTAIAGTVVLPTVANSAAGFVKTASDGTLSRAASVAYSELPTDVGVVARKRTLVGTGSGTTIALTHGLGTNLVTAQVYDTSTSTATLVETDITVTSTVATATFAATTTLSNYTLVVVG